MSSLVGISHDNGVAVLTINNPPVNALSDETRERLREAVEQADQDDAVKAIVIIGGGRTFVAGADIHKFVEYTSGRSKRVPGALMLARRIEDCRKPVVAAIHGTAFGGGLELAMGCHYRVALAGTQVGQPEVKLGIIPGAGGTQRLPRLAGVAKAAEMCAEGNPVKAEEALRFGILDRVVASDLLAAACAFAREVAGKPVTKTRERNEKLANAEENEMALSAARASADKKRGLMAPLKAVEAVAAATLLPFDEGCEVEQRLFDECLFSEQSKALVHAFLAEREVAKIPDIPKETAILPVNRVGVLGAGTMGGGIAMVFANAGITVLLKDSDQAALDRGLQNIQKNYAASVKRGRLTQQFVDERLKLIQPTLTYDGFDRVDMVVEAVFEGMEVKKAVFAELDRVCRPGAILASNTSYMDIDEIASSISRPEAVVGTHFFSPAHVMRLLEVVRGERSSKEVIATCMQLSKRLGKIGVLVGNCRGFVGNRMFSVYRREAVFLVEEGATPEAVDKALVAFGMAMGPLSVADLAGLDIAWRTRQEFRHLQPPGMRQPIAEDYLCEMGRFGQKSGAGWYKYDEKRQALPDPEVVQVVHKRAAEAGIAQREFSAEEIRERCLYMMINEGARILEEGYALRAGDIDIIYLNGYGFPNYRGGPMWYADTIGLKNIYERVCELHRRQGDIWKPAPLLERLAKEGKTFAEFSREKAARA